MCIVTSFGERICVEPRTGPAAAEGGVHVVVTDTTTGHRLATVTLNHEQFHEFDRLLHEADAGQH